MSVDYSSENESKKYDAFISYSHAADGRLAPALQRAIHRFAKPWYRLRAARTFRDQTNLSINPHLWTSIESALSGSSFLLLLASPEAANSKWVRKEVDFWLQTRSPETIFMVLTDGELVWNDVINEFDSKKTNALPSNLFKVFQQEPLYIDLRWAKTEDDFSLRHTKFREAVGKVAAALRRVEPDLLFGEDVRQHRRTRMVVAIVGAILLALTIYSSVTTIKERRAKNEALTNLAKNYLKQGRQELDSASPLQALTYMAEAHRVAPFWPITQYMVSHAMRVTNNQRVLIFNPTGFKKAWLSDEIGRALLLRNDGILEVWDWVNKIRLSRIPGNFDELDYIALTKQGRRVITAKNEGVLQFWDAEKGKIIFEPQEHPKQVRKATSDPQGKRMIAIDKDYIVWLWDLPRKKLVKKIDYNVWDADLSPNGDYLVTGSGNGFLGIWNAIDGNGIAFLESPKDAEQKRAIWPFVKFAIDRNRILAINRSEAIILDLAENPKENTYRRLKGHTNIHTGTFSPDGKQGATFSWDGTVALWDIETAKMIALLENHHKKEKSGGWVYYSRDGKKLLTLAAGPRTAKVWDTEIKKLMTSIDGPRGWILATSFDFKNDSLITVDTHGALRSWGLGPDNQVSIETKVGDLQAAAFNIDATRIAIGGTLGVAVVDTSNGALIEQTINESDALGTSLAGFAFSPDGRKVLRGRFGAGPILWNISTKNNSKNLPKVSIGTFHAAFSPNGKSYATVELDGTLRVWYSEGDDPPLVIPLGGVSAVAFSPDGRDIVAKSKEGIKIFDIETKAPKRHLKANEEDCVVFTYSPDGTKIAAAGRNGNSYVWDAITGDLVLLLRGHESVVRDIRYSRDGYRLMTASMDGTVRVWDASTGELLALLHGGVGPILAVTEKKDEGTIVTISESGKIQKWNQSKEESDTANIAKILECRNPWTITSGGIVHRASIPSNCKGN